jgi:hypothetical protein
MRHGVFRREFDRREAGAALTVRKSQLYARRVGAVLWQDKVRYDEFDVEVLSTEHFDIYYYEGAGAGRHLRVA